MAEPGNSAMRSLLQKLLVRVLLKLALGLVAVGVVAFAAVVIYNALSQRMKLKKYLLLVICSLSLTGG